MSVGVRGVYCLTEVRCDDWFRGDGIREKIRFLINSISEDFSVFKEAYYQPI